MTSKNIWKEKDYLSEDINRLYDVKSWQMANCLSSSYQRKIRINKLKMYYDIAVVHGFSN